MEIAAKDHRCGLRAVKELLEFAEDVLPLRARPHHHEALEMWGRECEALRLWGLCQRVVCHWFELCIGELDDFLRAVKSTGVTATTLRASRLRPLCAGLWFGKDRHIVEQEELANAALLRHALRHNRHIPLADEATVLLFGDPFPRSAECRQGLHDLQAVVAHFEGHLDDLRELVHEHRSLFL